MPRRAPSTAHIPQSFIDKKHRILTELAIPVSEYSDKSPKGSVDAQILDLIHLINGYEGWVTTSSCAGRAAVFVDGAKEVFHDEVEAENPTMVEAVNGTVTNSINSFGGDGKTPIKKTKASPGGKGGGRWLYVSHDPIPTVDEADEADNASHRFTNLFGLDVGLDHSAASPTTAQAARLIHLQYSPLILHIFCATLHHAKPLLAAAINAGFRESGVQSLKALDDPESGVMLAVRTSGLVFETVIGTLQEVDNGREDVHIMVSEEYLRTCATVVNARFEWNKVRKQRLTKEVVKILNYEEQSKAWEDDSARARRKREEGLRRQAKKSRDTASLLPTEEQAINTDLTLLDTT